VTLLSGVLASWNHPLAPLPAQMCSEDNTSALHIAHGPTIPPVRQEGGRQAAGPPLTPAAAPVMPDPAASSSASPSGWDTHTGWGEGQVPEDGSLFWCSQPHNPTHASNSQDFRQLFHHQHLFLQATSTTGTSHTAERCLGWFHCHTSGLR